MEETLCLKIVNVVFEHEAMGTSVFMKSSNSKMKSAKTAIKIRIEDQKIWLMYDSPMGYHRQLLVGEDENTTNNVRYWF